MMRRLSMALLPALVVVATSRESRAFVRSTTEPDGGVDVAWATRSLSWALSKPANSPDIAPGCPFPAAEAAIEASFATWQAIPCTELSFTYLGPTDRIDVGFDPDASNNLNLFVFRDSGLCHAPGVVPAGDPCLSSDDEVACANLYNCWGHPDGDIYALTTTWYNTKTGLLADSDTEFNATPTIHRFTATAEGLPACADPLDSSEDNCISTDVQNTATHEIGHLLGLGHSFDPSATMAFTANYAETSKRHLAPDDIDGICAIYPRWRPDSGNGGSSKGCSSTGAPALALMAFVFVLRLKRAPRHDTAA